MEKYEINNLKDLYLYLNKEEEIDITYTKYKEEVYSNYNFNYSEFITITCEKYDNINSIENYLSILFNEETKRFLLTLQSNYIVKIIKYTIHDNEFLKIFAYDSWNKDLYQQLPEIRLNKIKSLKNEQRRYTTIDIQYRKIQKIKPNQLNLL